MEDAELNEPQAAAVAHASGPLLVFAGAGSGKTRVITYRIANLVACEGVAPWRILAVTFTNKAAGEMRARLQKLCGPEMARALWVGTFHATCAKLLRAHGEAVGIKPNFVIYDASDQKAVVDAGPEGPRSRRASLPGARRALGASTSTSRRAAAPTRRRRHSYVDDVALRIFRTYEERLRAANAVDFEDLILLVARLLEKTPEGDRIRRRYDYVLVDEFQDTNAIQYRFLRDLVRDHGNLCVVGDDDQSIYRWRGADVRNIRDFRSDFPQTTVVKLEQNYRSSKRIVAARAGHHLALERARAQGAVDRQRGRAAHPRRGGARRARRGGLRGRVDRRARGKRASTFARWRSSTGFTRSPASWRRRSARRTCRTRSSAARSSTIAPR